MWYYYRPIRRMGKVLFSQVSVCPQGRYPSPRLFPRSLVPCALQRRYPSPKFFPWPLVPGSFRGYSNPSHWSTPVLEKWGYLSPGWGYPNPGQGGYPPSQDKARLPPCQDCISLPPPTKTEQQSVYLLCSGRYYPAVTQEDFLVGYLFMLVNMFFQWPPL